LQGGDAYGDHRPPRPGRFSLRELFILTALVCVAGALFSWVRTEPAYAIPPFGAAVLATIVYLIHMTTRWSALQIVTSIVLIAVLLLMIVCVMPPVSGARHAARRAGCQNNLHNIALALQQYETTYGCFPPPYIADTSGKPLHSWRVLLLPYLDQKNLYSQYHFDEPWDGPNNSKLHSTVLKIYQCPAHLGKWPTTDTSYAVVVGPKTIWPDQSKFPIRMVDIIDGTSSTILVVEVANSGIHWMEPRDLHISQMPMAINPPRGQGISSEHPHGAHVAFADGSVRLLPDDTPPATLRAALTRNGIEPPNFP
jgi:prepilin-type processing-associated H-X9-DG protein